MHRSGIDKTVETLSYSLISMNRPSLRPLLASLMLLFSVSVSSFGQAMDWLGDKYSMFIHYGLYSIFGGEFDGKPVKEGYSEQILTFGVHFSDWYEEAAKAFTAERFDADSIALLAKKSGMRSVVLTSKHHDGFCLFRTSTTDYNSYDGAPAHRDLVGEMAQACRKAGLGFGIYFSLIDWHYPYAVPFSSHNADRITPEHHRYNLAQVTELLTNYGPVDELWFDMGSLTVAQSAELYALVHRLQPHCMVSGRLGNDYADFAVMADNALPDYEMELPWQTAASIFPETWGYRKWQDRSMPVRDKAAEKLSELIRVVTGGGKYLLNIGPKGDGSVVSYEQSVLESIGEMIEPIAEALYGTHRAPFGELMTLSPDNKTLYLFVPKGQTEKALPALNQSPTEAFTLKGNRPVAFRKGDNGTILLENIPAEGQWTVVKAIFDGPVSADLSELVAKGRMLDTTSATPLFTQSSADYYASFRAISGYRWVVPEHVHYAVRFPAEYTGREVVYNETPLVLRRDQSVLIGADTTFIRPAGKIKEGTAYGLMGRVLPEKTDLRETEKSWTDSLFSTAEAHTGTLYSQKLTVPQPMVLPLRFDFAQGLLVYLNGRYIDGALTREENGTLTLLLPLRKGENDLVVKVYNLTGKSGTMLKMTPLPDYELAEMNLPAPKADSQPDKSYRIIELKRPRTVPAATPAHLSSLMLLRR